MSGPGTVTFVDPSAMDTTASFSAVGTYVLRLTADDGELAASDEMAITVAADEVPLLYFAYTDVTTFPGGLNVDNEDIVSFDGTDYSMIFDGSDLGLSALKIDAIDFIDADEILISFTSSASLPGITGTVDDSDIVKFTATQLGDTTAGTFELFFDASDVGLVASDVEAIELLDDGRLLISTKGDFSVPQFTGQEEDIIALTPTSLGETTAGSWSLYFDGNDVGLTGAGVDGIAVGDDGTIYITSGSSFSGPGFSGKDEDVYAFHPSSLGDATAGTFDSTPFFDGSLHGAGGDLQSIDVGISPINEQSPLMVQSTASPQPDVGPLDASQLAPIVDEAILRLSQSVSSAVAHNLADFNIEIVDLPGSMLGRALTNVIQIDVDAAGFGWFVDATPNDDAEFRYDAATDQFVSPAGSPASERVDLLTVVLHELGHVLDFEHTDSHGLMDAELPLGTRRLPGDPSEPLREEKLAVDLTTWNVDALFQRFGGRDDAVWKRWRKW